MHGLSEGSVPHVALADKGPRTPSEVAVVDGFSLGGTERCIDSSELAAVLAEQGALPGAEEAAIVELD